jgi:hypothetical protein
MVSEFQKQFNSLNITPEEKTKLEATLNSAKAEFPCLSCPSNADCNSFKWYLKWFGLMLAER